MTETPALAEVLAVVRRDDHHGVVEDADPVEELEELGEPVVHVTNRPGVEMSHPLQRCPWRGRASRARSPDRHHAEVLARLQAGPSPLDRPEIVVRTWRQVGRVAFDEVE